MLKIESDVIYSFFVCVELKLFLSLIILDQIYVRMYIVFIHFQGDSSLSPKQGTNEGNVYYFIPRRNW